MAHAKKDKPENAGGELIMSERGKLIACLENAHVLLRGQKRWRFRLNEMGGVVQITSSDDWHNLTAAAVTAVTRWVERNGLYISSGKVGEVVAELANESRVHPVRDYLRRLKWDSTARLDDWLVTYLGSQDTPYTRAIGRCWLISAVARVFNPGCQADHVLLLLGPQGIKKSSALRTLAVRDEWFIDDLRDIRSKDALLQFGGVWIVECGELDAFRGADISRLKAFITSRVDNYRPPYARVSESFPRSVVFAASANEEWVLKDATGGRRFWPFECGTIDLEGLSRDRDQLWAEAVATYRQGAAWHLTDQQVLKLAQIEQENARAPHPYEDEIEEYLSDKDEITIKQIFKFLEQPRSYDSIRPPTPRAPIERAKREEMEIADSLKALGWTRDRVGIKRTRSWIRVPHDTEQSDPPRTTCPNEVVLPESRRNPTPDPPDPPDPPRPHIYARAQPGIVGNRPKGGPGGSPNSLAPEDQELNTDPPGKAKMAAGGPPASANQTPGLNGRDSIVTTGIPGDSGLPPSSAWNGSSFLELVEGEGVDLDDLDRMTPPDDAYTEDWSGFAEVDEWLRP